MMSIGGLSIPIGVELVLDSLYLDLHPEVGSIEAFCSSGGLVEGLSCSSRERMAIPFHMPWRHPDSCITDKGVLVRSGISRVWLNPMCDPVLRRSDNTIMSIHDFLCMPSLDKATVREEPHGLDTSILGIVVDCTTSPAPAGTVIPRASLIFVTRPNPKVVTKADHATKRKTSIGPEISTNAVKKTRSSQKVSEAGSSGLATRDGVEQTDNGTLDDDGQRDGLEFAMEDIRNLNNVSQDVTYPPILLPNKEVKAHAELSGGVMRTTRASFNGSHCVSEDVSSPAQEVMPAPDTQPLYADVGADEIASDGNVDPYYEARVSNTAGDVLERDLLPFVLGPYYIPYPYDEDSRSKSPPYTRDYWKEIHGVNLGLRKKELYMDPKVCRTALDRFTTPAETYRLRELSLVELSDWMSSTVRANEEVSRLKAELGALKFKCKATEQKLSSWDKKHRKYRNERDALAIEKEKTEEELVGTKSRLKHHESQAEEIQDNIASFFQSDFTPLVRKFLKSGEFNQAFTGVLNTAISVGVERRLRMDRTDEEFRGLSQKVVGFIPDAKSSLQDITRLEPDRVTYSHQTSSDAASLRANTHIRHSTSSSGTFGHTSTPEHLKKKKKFVEKGGPSAA
ncbi:hypothetical protein Tco_0815440 [Tanacetum coccineum]